MPVRSEPPDADPAAQVCSRCAEPMIRGTAAQLTARAIHVRCLTGEVVRDAREQRQRAGLSRLSAAAAIARAKGLLAGQRNRAELDGMRAHAARVRSEELMERVRVTQPTCPTCRQHMASSGGVLFQGDQLVHATCWRADPKPLDTPPPA